MKKSRKILIMGLPGSGKTTLANRLAEKLNAVHFNADEVRTNLNKDLGFSKEHRIEHARRFGWICDKVASTGNFVVADFVCPTKETREAFGECFLIFLDTIKEGRFEDTNKMFEPPENPDIVVKEKDADKYSDLIREILIEGD